MQNYAYAIYVVAHICLAVHLLFGRHISACAAWLLENGIAVAVGKSEVYNLQTPSVVGNHDVRRLQVAMGYLMRMDIFYCIEQLVGNAQTLRLRWVGFQSLIEGDTFYVFHNDAYAYVVHLLKCHCLHHS